MVDEVAIDRLLHDAEQADSGATMARMMRDATAESRLVAKRDRLIRMALATDPQRTADAWEETTLVIPKVTP